MGDTVSVYSEKAFRKNNGTYFEALGNVVITTTKDTIYGEKASIDIKSGQVYIEGSVRYVGKDLTLYGSRIDYNLKSEEISIEGARLITPEFSVVANQMVRRSESRFYAKEAEFTTCRDCTESWQVYGKEIEVEIGQYVQIFHALIKVKGIDVVYIPYIALPIKNKRESGVLFPNVYTRNDEGVSYEQPFYWAISQDKDLTFTPTFLAQRGYGLDLEYRQAFGDRSWLEVTNKSVVDKIYLPENSGNSERQNDKYYRNFLDFEAHQQISNDFSHHLRVVGVKDLDIFNDFYNYTSDFAQTSDPGIDYWVDKRFDHVNLYLEANYRRNLLTSDPEGFDSSYVQTLPKVGFSTKPYVLFQNQNDFFYRSIVGVDGEFISFKQNRIDEVSYLRNTSRFDVSPYLKLSLLNKNGFVLETTYKLDQQSYDFLSEGEENFTKNAGQISTELSFTLDRIFGLAYNEEYSTSEISPRDLKKIDIYSEGDDGNALSTDVLGALPRVDQSLQNPKIQITRHSYKHSQEYRFIHHQILHDYEGGNEQFKNQISQEEGWFDYRDAILREIQDLESNEARKTIPLNNTFEIQWNNVLTKKTAKQFNYLEDEKYLKDNFTYKQIGFFNISQGFLLKNGGDSFSERLTRLFIDTGYNGDRFFLRFKDYFVHQEGNHILSFSGQKRFDSMSLLGEYQYNSFSDSSLKTIKTGIQFRPIDAFGISFLKEQDLNANENVSSIYQVDFMPDNNCWIINLTYQDSLVTQNFSFNFVFNFGNDTFKEYKTNYFSFARF